LSKPHKSPKRAGSTDKSKNFCEKLKFNFKFAQFFLIHQKKRHLIPVEINSATIINNIFRHGSVEQILIASRFCKIAGIAFSDFSGCRLMSPVN
jgi:uncharacterized protein VirK/YbjX